MSETNEKIAVRVENIFSTEKIYIFRAEVLLSIKLTSNENVIIIVPSITLFFAKTLCRFFAVSNIYN